MRDSISGFKKLDQKVAMSSGYKTDHKNRC